ncbi:MAG: formate--tetrahydrofolate ligase [Alphaproteobacteria bacterium]|nr:formate--tetrahydrofolate ligase [Alphaproteobacteria bacterium]
MKSDIEIAHNAKKEPVTQIANKLGINDSQLLLYGPYKAKLALDSIPISNNSMDGKLILVTAMTPTPAGEGKTTTTIGLGDALKKIGKKALICLREPSLGPCFGMKGGAAGGGYAQVIPMEDINLHFTGDIHAITSAHNLLAAMIDNHIHWGNKKGIDQRQISWCRVLDMNDRALRSVVTSLGGKNNGYPRQDSFDITAASEVMAILCLASDIQDFEQRVANIIIGQTNKKKKLTAEDMQAAGAMATLLKDAIMPNLVQTLENNPVFIHGGPFANIAHGCNSVIATRTALKLADYVVTEAGFGADLGAEKFFNIKCRKAGLQPAAAVIVATIRALKMHGGIEKNELENENTDAVRKGCVNLHRHINNVKKFGVPVIVAINSFIADTENEIKALKDAFETHGVEVILCNHWAKGSDGACELAEKVVELCESSTGSFQTLYKDEIPLCMKVETIAKEIYGADGISTSQDVRNTFSELQEEGYGKLPVCIAKTQYSFSTNPDLKGAPSGHTVPIREVRLSAGAGFVVVVTDKVMTMPGLPEVPAAHKIRINQKRNIEGLF